jgi:hypothetical protein
VPLYRFVSKNGERDGGIGFLDDDHALDFAERLTASTGGEVVVYDHRNRLVGVVQPKSGPTTITTFGSPRRLEA